MSILILNAHQIEELLPMRECIDVMHGALVALARGQVHQPVRTIIQPPSVAGLVGLMPAHMTQPTASLGLKVICVFPENPARGIDSHQGSVLLLSPETGELLAVMNAAPITAIRTAAVSGVATRVLAREDASSLTIIGSGVQARTHLSAMAAVRPIRSARVVSRQFAHAQRLVNEVSRSLPFPIEAVETVKEAVRGAEIIVTATGAPEPVLKGEWIAAGCHVNAIGAAQPHKRELDTDAIRSSGFFVDQREAAMKEAGDYLLAAREGGFGPEHIRAELGEVLIGAKPGRKSRDEITCFKSLGLAVEDVAAAQYLYQVARERRTGQWVDY